MTIHAGANSIFYGDTLLTTDNPPEEADRALFARLGIEPLEPDRPPHEMPAARG